MHPPIYKVRMPDWILILLFAAAWFVVNRWLLPRLGVPT
jgi:hypothetical protein